MNSLGCLHNEELNVLYRSPTVKVSKVGGCVGLGM